MTFEQIIALLAMVGALLALLATAVGSICLWILGGIRGDIHAIRMEFIDRFKIVESRVDNLWGDRTDSGLGTSYRRRE